MRNTMNVHLTSINRQLAASAGVGVFPQISAVLNEDAWGAVGRSVSLLYGLQHLRESRRLVDEVVHATRIYFAIVMA